MGLVRALLLAAVVFAAAAVAASQGTPSPPPLLRVKPVDIPPVPPCLDDLAQCASVYQDRSMLAPCCSGLKKSIKNDPTCLCDLIQQAVNSTAQSGYTVNGGAIFRQCGISGNTCGHGTAGNAAPNARSIGAFRILLLLPLFFMM